MAKSGIHHITAISSTTRENYDFYTKTLGMRFVKKTVNYDDPGTYHFYYADRVGSPGSVLTFFPHPGLPQGRLGRGQAVEIGFAVPKNALAFWEARFKENGIPYQGPAQRFDETYLRIADPDGLILELVGVDDFSGDEVWATEEIDAASAIRGFHNITLWVGDRQKTARVLTAHLGFHPAGEDEERYRYATGEKGPGQIVDIRELPEMKRGLPGAGTIHHVAWRVGDEADERKIRDALIGEGLNLTPVIDRNYFRSVYFREPGGIIFELATDNPGFAVDEDVETLGRDLKLPPQYEARRAAITAALPPLE